MWKYLRVKELRFWNCDLSDGVLRDLASLISQKSNMIQSIEIEYDQKLRDNLTLHNYNPNSQPNINPRGFCLTNFLQSSPKLKFVSLYETNLRTEHVNDFLRFWVENSESDEINLEHLDLYGNKIDHETLELLLKLLESYHKLKFIGLGRTGLGSDSTTQTLVFEILKMFQFRNGVEAVKVKSKRNGKGTGFSPVVKMVNDVKLTCLNGLLETLDLRENDFSQSFASELSLLYYEAPVTYQLVVALNKKPLNFEILSPKD